MKRHHDLMKRIRAIRRIRGSERNAKKDLEIIFAFAWQDPPRLNVPKNFK
jgi:hypothetical protein